MVFVSGLWCSWHAAGGRANEWQVAWVERCCVPVTDPLPEPCCSRQDRGGRVRDSQGLCGGQARGVHLAAQGKAGGGWGGGARGPWACRMPACCADIGLLVMHTDPTEHWKELSITKTNFHAPRSLGRAR